MKKLSLILVLLILNFFLSGKTLASSAESVTETQIKGEGEVYQYVETTVNGETVSKESHEPGKLELKMEKIGEEEPTVTFSQEPASPTPEATTPVSFVSRIIEFFRNLFSRVNRALFWGLTSL